MIPTKYDTPLTGLDWLEYYGKHNVYHPGADFNKGVGNADCGQNVVAAKSGFVEYVWNSVWNSGGFGKFVILVHNDGTFTRYAHLQDIEENIRSGKQVQEGDLLGHVGNTGTTYCHLHFEVFNKECASRQSRHTRYGVPKPWRWYPSGMSKADVQKYYINPWEWLKEKSDGIPKWATVAVTWARSQGLIRNFEGNAMSDYEIALVIYRLYKKFHENALP